MLEFRRCATIEAHKIHKFIQDHDQGVLDSSEKEDTHLLLETLGMQEFCNIAFMTCQEDVSTMIDKLKGIAKDFPNILDQDDKDMALAYEKARVIAMALGRAPR